MYTTETTETTRPKRTTATTTEIGHRIPTTRNEREDPMNTNTLAAGVVGFLLGGLVVSIAAELEDGSEPAPAHSSTAVHQGSNR